jgi:hypothetical protein
MTTKEAATYERARRLANISLWAVDLQCRRLSSTEPEDTEFIFRKWADFDFLIVSLTRLRRAAKLTANIPQFNSRLSAALREFDASLPHLKKMRDVAEHVDDYARDIGRDKSVHRQSLEVSSMTDDGPELEWLEGNLNSQVALVAGQKLFAAIQEVGHVFTADAKSP